MTKGRRIPRQTTEGARGENGRKPEEEGGGGGRRDGRPAEGAHATCIVEACSEQATIQVVDSAVCAKLTYMY